MRPAEAETDSGYRNYVLGVLMLVYALNFIDRQLITILAPDLKRDLGISDSDFGFLYGTAFGVFYAVFGIPLGKLADHWSRVRLLTVGLALWSAMTAMSGFARNFAQLGAARIGVGVGEATASPCAYSLVSDYFPPHRRALALSVYSAGLYLGGGISLAFGSKIAADWNAHFAVGQAPFGLVGWQVAFLAVGVPGLLLALLVTTLREPPRGRFDPPEAEADVAAAKPLADFMRSLEGVLPPFTLFAAARHGTNALAINALGAAIACLLVWGMAHLTGDLVQWAAFALGCYAVFSWGQNLRLSDRPTFDAVCRSRALVGVTLGYGLVTIVGYAMTAFAPLYAIEVLGANPREAGFMLGGAGTLGGIIGVVGAGALADRLAGTERNYRRVWVIAGTAVGSALLYALMFTATSRGAFYALNFIGWIFFSGTLGGSSGAVVNAVAPRVRGIATAGFVLGSTLLGLALGPYSAGKFSSLLGSLGDGLLVLLVVVPFGLAALAVAERELRRATRTAPGAGELSGYA
ncbi:MFS transporter [Novosphingobium sp. G106]|uniref:MFS transporter n=1 Tax=Novosphingobium sp. G106 TaxID=2849500 RepID=UPI001C2D9ADE|nr:MFS transporter [Novosphingobium sp. G106]MBV1689860.1 MFS transporter [Novosphingobium sp. G106]